MSVIIKSIHHCIKWLLTLLLTGIFIVACSESSTEPKPQSNIEEIRTKLQEMLDNHIANNDFPGAVLSVIINGEDEINLAAGLADIENNILAKTTDRFRIASITKTFTAATILRLQEQGVLNINNTIDQYVPELQIPLDSVITIRHLLSHTSGLADHEDGPGMDLILATLIQDPTHVFSPYQLIQLGLSQGFHFNPGEGFSYSNTGYVILGLIIESVSATTYSQAVHSLIIEPLGLNNTFVPLPEDESIPGEHLHGYEFFNGTLTDLTLLNHSWTFAEGEMISNTQDLTVWIKKLVTGEVFEQAATAEIMQSFINAGDGLEYGLGLIKNPFLGIGHDGSTIGFTGDAYYDPVTGITIVDGINTGFDGIVIYEALNIIRGN